MRQGCKLIDLEKTTIIRCGGEPIDHKCNEDAMIFDTVDGDRIFFKNLDKADQWYKKNNNKVRSASIACSICERAAIDNAMFLDI